MRGVGKVQIHADFSYGMQWVKQADTGNLHPALLVELHERLSRFLDKKSGQVRGLDRGIFGESLNREMVSALDDAFDSSHGLPDIGPPTFRLDFFLTLDLFLALIFFLFLRFHIGSDQREYFFECGSQIQMRCVFFFGRRDQIIAFLLSGANGAAGEFPLLYRLSFQSLAAKQGLSEKHTNLRMFPIVLKVMKDPFRKVK